MAEDSVKTHPLGPSVNPGLYSKYRITSVLDGSEKEGRYFFLRLDTEKPNEFKAVIRALEAYAAVKREGGFTEIADDIQSTVRVEVQRRYGEEIPFSFDKPKEETNDQGKQGAAEGTDRPAFSGCRTGY